MIKLLHIYAGNLFGGIETVLIAIASAEQAIKPHNIEKQGHFALCFEGRLADELRAIDDTKVHILGNVKLSKPWLVWRARKHLQELITQEKFDIVICHSCWPQVIFGPVVKSAKLPLVFWCHDTPTGKPWLERLARQIKPDWVIANSSYTFKAFPNLYPQANGEVIYTPLAAPNLSNIAEIRQKLREELQTTSSSVVIIQASRLERWKGHHLLLTALGKLREQSDWVCWIVGGIQRPQERVYFQELQKQAQQLGIAERVRFLGQRSDVSQLLASADIFCQSNTGPEPFGVVFIEAFYAGLPVVTTATGGALDIVDESCGYLVPPHHSQALSKVLANLIINSELRVALGNSGKLRADQLCNPKKQLHQLYATLSTLLDQEKNL